MDAEDRLNDIGGRQGDILRAILQADFDDWDVKVNNHSHHYNIISNIWYNQWSREIKFRHKMLLLSRIVDIGGCETNTPREYEYNRVRNMLLDVKWVREIFLEKMDDIVRVHML